MTKPKLISFEHPNKKAKIEVFTSQIFAVMEMPENNVVALVGPGGALVPVVGTLESVKERLLDAAAEEDNKNE